MMEKEAKGDNDKKTKKKKKKKNRGTLLSSCPRMETEWICLRAAPDNANKMFTPLFASSLYSPFVFLSQFGVFALLVSSLSLSLYLFLSLALLWCVFILFAFCVLFDNFMLFYSHLFSAHSYLSFSLTFFYLIIFIWLSSLAIYLITFQTVCAQIQIYSFQSLFSSLNSCASNVSFNPMQTFCF